MRCTVGECSLPIGPFERLIEANRLDQVVTRYETFAQLLGYCQLSAAPVGELVLDVFGAATPTRVALSDRVCAGLQVVEHLQDIAEDHGRGRVYMPREDLSSFGCGERTCAARAVGGAAGADRVRGGPCARACSAAARRLRARCRLAPRLAVAGFVAGGRRRARRARAWPARAARRGYARHAAENGGGPMTVAAIEVEYAYRECEQITRARGRKLLLRHPPAAALQAPGDVRRLRVRAARR